MARIEWSDDYSVGIEKFDQQHQRIVTLINKVHEAAETGQEKSILTTVFNSLVGYTKNHFSEEERLMREHGYQNLEKHKEDHQKLNLELAELYRKFFTSNKPLTDDLLDLLNRWLFIHILAEDKQYSAFFAGKDVNN